MRQEQKVAKETQYLCNMKTNNQNDQICGGVAAQEYVETLANELDNAFAQGESYELGIDEIQVWFDFILVGEPECPQKIVVESNGFHHQSTDIENPDGLSVWGMCLKAAESFLDLLVSEYGYNPVCE